MRILLATLCLAGLLFQLTCKDGNRLEKALEGVALMNGDIFPEVVQAEVSVLGIYNDRRPGTFIIVDTGGTVHRGRFDNGRLTTERIESVRIDAPCKQLRFDPERQILYGYGVRDFHAIDLKTGQYRSRIVCPEGDGQILFVVLLKDPDIRFLIQSAYSGWTNADAYSMWSLYDFGKDAVVHESGRMSGGGMLYPITDSTLLFQQWKGSDPTEWYFTDNTLTQRRTNAFTEALSGMDVVASHNAVNIDQQIVAGWIRTTEQLVMVRWESDYSDHTILPLTFHIPRDRAIHRYFEISPSGNWIKSISKAPTLDIHDDKIVFYHANHKYPAGLSLAVHGGESCLLQYYPGVFVQTEDWGMVYVDICMGTDAVLFVYKMNDVLEQIALRAREMVQ